MVVEVSTAAYSRRAREYTQVLGSMDTVHPSDLQLVSKWASDVDGEIVDAGCGPGHWTSFLTEQGHAARGVDLVPEFVTYATNTFPGVSYTLGSLDSLAAGTGSLGGILAWYSLIHYEPETIRIPLQEFSRTLKPGGTLLVGFFEGQGGEEFTHAVTLAYRWSVDDFGTELNATGFDVVESHVRKTAGQRPVAAIIARRRDAPEGSPRGQ